MKKTYATEVGLLAVWNPDFFKDVDTLKKYQALFVENSDILRTMNAGQAVVWGTGGDGDFGVSVRINPDQDLTEDEKKVVDMKALNLRLIVTGGRVLIGSPEVVGSVEQRALDDGAISVIENIEAGAYLVNIYFLYDPDAMDLDQDEYLQKLEADPDFDKSGHIVVLRKVAPDYVFPPIIDFPQLG